VSEGWAIDVLVGVFGSKLCIESVDSNKSGFYQGLWVN